MTVGAGRTSADPRRTKLRTALGMRLEALADYRLARVRGVRAGEADALEAEHGGLASVEARERLCEIRDSGGELDIACDAALAQHLIRIGGEHASSEEQDELDAAWTSAVVATTERSLRAPAALRAALDEPERNLRARWATALSRAAGDAVGPWLGLRAAESEGRTSAAYTLGITRDAERAALPERARTLLAESDDLAKEALDFLGAGRVRGDTWTDVAAAIEAPSPHGHSEAPERRVRRVTAWLADLGLTERVARHVRVCPVDVPLVEALPLRATKVALVVGTGAGERIEREAACAVGEAVARALVDPTLPIEVRWPAWPWLPRLVGALAERLLSYPYVLLRLVDETRRPEDRARRFALSGVLRLRLVAAGVVAAAEGPRGREAASEIARSAIERAIGVSVAPELAALWLPRRWRAEVDLSARLAALAVERALMERHDEDFFRNPRTGRTLAALCAAGAMASADTVRDVTGADVSSAGAATLVSLLRQTGAV